jgi:hypothetical protein
MGNGKSNLIGEEGRRKKEEGRRKKEEGRRKKDEGRRKLAD